MDGSLSKIIPNVKQLVPGEYRNPGSLPDGGVLVVVPVEVMQGYPLYDKDRVVDRPFDGVIPI